jgi:DNA-binding response OmpR family regulator
MASPTTDTTVLVVDDERDVADAYAVQLQIDYETRVAYGGEDALETIDEDVDVVLLDRRMPDLSGDEVLSEIRNRDLDCSVIMVTAVDPDFDIVEMPFEDYLCKPVARDELIDVIETQLSVSEYDSAFQEYMELTKKLEILKDEKPAEDLKNNEQVQELSGRVEELQESLDDIVHDFDDSETAFRDLV